MSREAKQSDQAVQVDPEEMDCICQDATGLLRCVCDEDR